MDEYPEDSSDMSGYQLMIADEVIRGKFRNGFENPEAVPANESVDYTINLLTRNHTFKKGHRIAVQVQSSWFPLIGRNPQTFVNIPEASEADYMLATHTIHGASYIEFPLALDQAQ
jgi:predicted acyl esterase